VPRPHTSPPLIRHLVHSLRFPEEFALAVSGVQLTVDFLAPQSRPTLVEQYQTPEWTLDFHKAHVRARVNGPLPRGWASLGLMRAPVPAMWYGASAQPGSLACTPPGTAIDGWFSPGFSCLAVNLCAERWEQCRQLAGAERVEFGSVRLVQLPADAMLRLEEEIRATRELLRLAARDAALATAALKRAEDLALHIGTCAWELSDQPRPMRTSWQNRVRLARRAEAWMRSNLGELLRVPELCQVLRVSRRELEYAFRTVWGESPRDFLHSLRLNAIRRELCRGRRAVTEVALEHGIMHLGRFSGAYRQLFSEAPSATLPRDRAATIRQPNPRGR
jgi:AraC family transcriptional regulator, ethanolamine operon transcriptional activator